MKNETIIKTLTRTRTQTEIADLLGISQSLVSRIINGSRPMPEPVRRLAIMILADEARKAKRRAARRSS